MFTIMSVISSVKDYVEIIHKFIETDSNFSFQSYFDFGAILTYVIFTFKHFFINLFSFNWFSNLWSIPIVIPEIASSIISEISVLDGYFHNIFTFLETPISYGNQTIFFSCLEKFSIGLINSLFLCIPTSTAHIITLRRFVMQGLEAGSIAGLGTISGNILWIASILFGWRFFVIPWLSLDILRYLLGFLLLTKYMWDSYTERRMVLEDISKWKIFLLNFLLAFIEQTSIFPFITNISIGSDASILETFPVGSFMEFVSIHSCYLLGILIGSLSLLQITCWFWENPAFKLYMWMISSFRVTTGLYYKFLNFAFLYITMIFAISNLAYFGLDYTVTQPLGFIYEDRIIDQKNLLETAFLSTKASDRNTRRNRGRHGRRERWKRRVRRYRTFDASLYDQGIYDLFTIEDLNYGFDRFWLRRKMRNHRVRFRFFPGPWMRSFKKQLARPRLESFMGPRVEFFRILFEQAYHPSFHELSTEKVNNLNLFLTKDSIEYAEKFGFNNPNKNILGSNPSSILIAGTSTPVISKRNEQLISPSRDKNINKEIFSFYAQTKVKERTRGVLGEFSTLRKFVRKVNNRIKMSQIAFSLVHSKNLLGLTKTQLESSTNKPIYSKKWKQLFSKLYNNNSISKNKVGRSSLQNSQTQLSKRDLQILNYRTFLSREGENTQTALIDTKFSNKPLDVRELIEPVKTFESLGSFLIKKEKDNDFSNFLNLKPLTLLHPIQFYLHKEQAFRRKLKFYGSNIFRNLTLENNAPYYRVMMRRYFYYYKPTLRWERTMRTATLRKSRRKGPRIPRRLNINKNIQTRALLLPKGQQSSVLFREKELSDNTAFSQKTTEFVDTFDKISPKSFVGEIDQSQKPTHFYSLVEKRATRYRYQIYKDVLQHWYYSPFNRLLLKFDIDSFIRRQPFSHFLTKKEEHLLHLRRFLLSEHYNTVRWYTFMQHYRSMKSKIGGTKSLASRVYNQQFQGTFKKIRHLFSMTPSLTSNSVLKFDQPLYNEYPNNKNYSILNDSIIHEELLTDEKSWPLSFSNSPLLVNNREAKLNLSNENLISPPLGSKEKSVNLDADAPYIKVDLIGNVGSVSTPVLRSKDLISQSTHILREYLITKTPIRQELIKKLLKDNNYWELTAFLYKGQKIRGTDPVTGNRTFLEQEKKAIYTSTELKNLQQQQQNQLSFVYKKIKQGMWIALIKKCYTRLYDQEAQKNYLTRRIEKREKRKQIREKHLKNRIQRINNWMIDKSKSKKNTLDFVGNVSISGQNNFLLNLVGSRLPPSRDIKVRGEVDNDNNILDLNNLNSSKAANSISLDFSKECNSERECAKETSNYPNSFLGSRKSQSIKKAIKEAIFLQKDTKHNQFLLQFPRSRLILHKKNIINTLETHFDHRLKMHIYQPPYLFREGGNNINVDNRRLSARADNNSPKISRGDVLNNLIKSHRTFSYNLKTSLNNTPRWWKRSLLKKRTNSIDTKFVLVGLRQRAITFLNKLGLNHAENNRNLNKWRKKERVLTKRKKTRKRLKRLKKKKIRTTDVSFVSDYRFLKNNINSKRNQGNFTDNNNLFYNNEKSIPFSENIRKKRDVEHLPYSTKVTSNVDFQQTKNQLQSNLISFEGINSQQNQIQSPEGIYDISKRKTWEKWLEKIKEQKQSKQLIEEKTINPNLINLRATNTTSKDIQQVGENKKIILKIRSFLETSASAVKKTFIKNFKTKRARRRRSRRMRPRGAIRKRTLGDKLKRQFKILRKYGDQIDRQDQKTFSLKNVFQIITGRNYKPANEFLIKEPKQRRALHRKHLFWKKHKRPKYAQNRRKKRKRRRTAIGKIKGLNKQLKRIQNEFQIKKWWWETFLPNLKGATDAFWEIEKNKQVSEKLGLLSSSNIMERDLFSHFNQNYIEKVPGEKTLQIGDRDYKPLAIPEALRIREDLIKKEILTFGTSRPEFMVNNNSINKELYCQSEKAPCQLAPNSNSIPLNSNEQQSSNVDLRQRSVFSEAFGKGNRHVKNIVLDTEKDVVNKLYQNTFNKNIPSLNSNSSKLLLGINPIPFYAGWDETLRKFVVTNRLLSRQEAGYEMNIKQSLNVPFNLGVDHSTKTHVDFSHFPLKGMNAATTLYWQIPFTTYDPDQFFALGMDGFSPIGWKRFHFKHSTKTAKPILVRTKTILSQIDNNKLENNQLSDNISAKSINNLQISNLKVNQEKSKQISHHRRIKKRYRRVKKHPRPPVWFPSGPLISQVLPVHYIYVFYKRYRLPRDRYIRRRMRRGKKGISQAILDIQFKFTDMTLRKRAKPRRRYHRKRSGRKTENLYPRRRQFKDFPFDVFIKKINFSETFSNFTDKQNSEGNYEKNYLIKRIRPIPRKRTAQQLQDLRLSKMKSKQRRKTTNYKQQPENIRIRQLRRRVQRQVIRPIVRYKPRPGGFVWPGDYLRLDLVKSPKLKKKQILSTELIMKKDKKELFLKQIRRKKKRNIQEWQIQPKRYLLQKHNIKVLKKRLEKAQRVNKIHQKTNELTYLLKKSSF